MEATPDVYRADIARTKEAIAQIDGDVARRGLPHETSSLRSALVRQLASLEQGLARAEALWTQAQAQGAGTRLP